MKPILIIQNCPIESGGTILDYLNQNAVSFQVFHSHNNTAFPALDNFEAIINLGCPTSVVDYQQHQFLKNLYSYVTQIVRVNKSFVSTNRILVSVLADKFLPRYWVHRLLLTKSKKLAPMK